MRSCVLAIVGTRLATRWSVDGPHEAFYVGGGYFASRVLKRALLVGFETCGENGYWIVRVEKALMMPVTGQV